MKSLRCMTGSLIFAVAVVFTAQLAPAQSSNSQAVNRLDAGVKDFQNFKNVQAQLDEQKLLEEQYVAGMAAFENKDWMQAVVALEKVQLLQPNYRETVDRLVQARVNLEMAGKTASLASSKESGGSSSYLGGVLAALVVLPLLGAALFSPATRARLHLMRGNYPAAIQIYESLLTQNPSRVKFYPTLANLYLLQGRRDENAMKVYRTILQLNLNTNNRDEINAIVAQNYLTEGRTDSDAIEVLESALKAEQRKQSHYS